jgi:hypothetical protein
MAGSGVDSNTCGNRRRLHVSERPRDGGQQRAALGAAGAVADGIRQEHIAQFVEQREVFRAAVSRSHQRQPAASALCEGLPGKSANLSAVADLPMLHCRLEPRRMREPASGESRVDQLPD